MQYWIVNQNPIGYNIDAGGSQYLSTSTVPPFGIYHFQNNTFVNGAMFGTHFFVVRALALEYQRQISKHFVCAGSVLVNSKSSTNYYCVAPVVNSVNQTKALFWVTGYNCCGQYSQSCWNAYKTPASYSAYAQTLVSSTMPNMYLNARGNSCARLVRLACSGLCMCFL